MSRHDNDEFGKRMKSYESQETARVFLPMLPVYARIDGRGFSKFTKGMDRPFDQRMTDAMIETTKHLVKETGALIGYVQSDEISLVWKAPDHLSSIFFDGKVFKMTSVLSGIATAAFNRAIRGWQPYEDRFPHFDARVCQMPLDYEAANMFLWRAMDAQKNSVSMAAHAQFPHKELQGKGRGDMKKMLAAAGIDFYQYPVAFREGTWLRRVTYEIPNPQKAGEMVTRSKIDVIYMPSFNRVTNRTEVIFEGAEPIERADP